MQKRLQKHTRDMYRLRQEYRKNVNGKRDKWMHTRLRTDANKITKTKERKKLTTKQSYGAGNEREK